MSNSAAARVLWCVSTALCSLTGCLNVREEAYASEDNGCTSCHGTPDPRRDAVLQAAPPSDLMGNTAPSYPGVGAHSAHLLAGPGHAPVACGECHAIPSSSATPGHADSALPAEVSFGPLSRTADSQPSYDAATRRCADTYCHGALSPAWTRDTLVGVACDGCHGLPPPAPHPQSDACHVCHADVIDDARELIAPDRHLDGHVDYRESACNGCHGGAVNAAPPPSLAGGVSADERGVGAHQAHLAGGAHSRPVLCAECHIDPDQTSPSTHPAGGPARVIFSGVAAQGEASPAWDAAQATCSDSWCHHPGQPREAVGVSWTLGQELACTACHGMPPAAPHPQAEDCQMCHADVYSRATGTIADPSRHVDGVIDVRVPESCTGCHGDLTPAPPPDLGGVTSNTAPGVGAHQAHLVPSGPARAVACIECHALPSSAFAPGHVDSPLPAEVRFSGVATAFEAQPVYGAGTCAQTYCHGDSFIGGRPSGGVETIPRWAASGASTALSCQSCHGMPPPAPHPDNADACSTCHRNIDDAGHFTAAATHVDGVVTFFLP